MGVYRESRAVREQVRRRLNRGPSAGACSHRVFPSLAIWEQRADAALAGHRAGSKVLCGGAPAARRRTHRRQASECLRKDRAWRSVKRSRLCNSAQLSSGCWRHGVSWRTLRRVEIRLRAKLESLYTTANWSACLILSGGWGIGSGTAESLGGTRSTRPSNYIRRR